MMDEQLSALLRGYTAPVADNGFTALVMKKASVEVARMARLRSRLINGAFFLGGAIAAIQLPKLVTLAADSYEAVQMNLPEYSAASSQKMFLEALSLAPSHVWIAVIGVAAFLFWTIADGDGLQL